MPRSKTLRPQQWSETPRSLADREWLREFVRWAKGDPKLSAWEASFISNIGYLAAETGPLPSDKQRAALDRIVAKLGYDAPDQSGSSSLDDDDSDFDGFEDCQRYRTKPNRPEEGDRAMTVTLAEMKSRLTPERQETVERQTAEIKARVKGLSARPPAAGGAAFHPNDDDAKRSSRDPP